MTNKERLFDDDRELAEMLIQQNQEENYDYDSEDELSYHGLTDYLETPDGMKFGCYTVEEEDWKNAIKHTIKWLHSEVIE